MNTTEGEKRPLLNGSSARSHTIPSPDDSDSSDERKRSPTRRGFRVNSRQVCAVLLLMLTAGSVITWILFNFDIYRNKEEAVFRRAPLVGKSGHPSPTPITHPLQTAITIGPSSSAPNTATVSTTPTSPPIPPSPAMSTSPASVPAASALNSGPPTSPVPPPPPPHHTTTPPTPVPSTTRSNKST